LNTSNKELIALNERTSSQLQRDYVNKFHQFTCVGLILLQMVATKDNSILRFTVHNWKWDMAYSNYALWFM